MNTQIHLCRRSLICHKFTYTQVYTSFPLSQHPHAVVNTTCGRAGQLCAVAMMSHSKRTHRVGPNPACIYYNECNTTFIGQATLLSILCTQELYGTPNIWEVYYMDCMQTSVLVWIGYLVPSLKTKMERIVVN